MYYNGDNIQKGYNEYINLAEDSGKAAMMDVGLLVLDDGESYTFEENQKEVAILLLDGTLTFVYNKREVTETRQNPFDNNPICLHIPAGVTATVTSKGHSEVYIQKTLNDKSFEAVFYGPTDTHTQRAGSNGELMGTMRRNIRTVFDYESAPYSNMVLGEVVNHPGKWSSYPPHYHPQPETYFYRFDKEQGFGAGFANNEIYKTTHNGLLVITENFHSQTAAPGYALCYVWGIRHLEGNPWEKTRIDNPEHSWLWEADANDHIWQPQD